MSFSSAASSVLAATDIRPGSAVVGVYVKMWGLQIRAGQSQVLKCGATLRSCPRARGAKLVLVSGRAASSYAGLASAGGRRPSSAVRRIGFV